MPSARRPPWSGCRRRASGSPFSLAAAAGGLAPMSRAIPGRDDCALLARRPRQRRLAFSAARGRRRHGAAHVLLRPGSPMERRPPRRVPALAPSGSSSARRGSCRCRCPGSWATGSRSTASSPRASLPMFGAGDGWRARRLVYGLRRRPALRQARERPRHSVPPARPSRSSARTSLSRGTAPACSPVANLHPRRNGGRMGLVHGEHRSRHDCQQPATTCPIRCSGAIWRIAFAT